MSIGIKSSKPEILTSGINFDLLIYAAASLNGAAVLDSAVLLVARQKKGNNLNFKHNISTSMLSANKFFG